MTTPTAATSRFEFGHNWEAYLAKISDAHLTEAQASFERFAGAEALRGKRFLDIGCGSGVHSYAAYRLGASEIVSFDYDPFSVDCTQRLKNDRAAAADHWRVTQGDVLDAEKMRALGPFDYVYAWGSLHHTGSMWRAIENASMAVAANGQFHVALYNKHWTSPIWRNIKRLYCTVPAPAKKSMLGLYETAEWLRIALVKRKNPRRFIEEYGRQRGMIWKEDLRDWLGGYPYEYASPGEVEAFLVPRGFSVVKRNPNRSIGCSEFLFRH